MLTCTHHIQWVRPVENGLHQCILCHQVVGRKDVYPKLEDLPAEFQKRWEAHEATRPAPAAAEEKPAAAEPKAAAKPAAAEAKPAVAAPKAPAVEPKAAAAEGEPAAS